MSANRKTPTLTSKKVNTQRASSFQLKPGEKLLKDAKPILSKTKGATKVPAQKKDANKVTRKEKPIFDKDVTQKFDDMIDGDLAYLPPMPKTKVKIFLSSTFSDMRAERNTLVRNVYPFLREYCASCGLDFQVVDMRWGITEDSINDHSVEKLCLLEVANCQKTSVGPNFIVLSGDRYGFRLIPVELNVKTFEGLQYLAKQLNLEKRNLLEEWYKLDENSVPNMYVLQPIRSKFTFFADFSPGCEELRQRDTDKWWKTFESLQDILRQAADAAFKEGKMTADDRHQYFLSVTECEIQDGILKAKDVNKHCLVYKRRLGMDNNCLQLKDAPRFIDVNKTEKGNVINKEVASLRESLFKDKIKQKLKDSNIKEYNIYWYPNGINPEENHEDRVYIERFCTDFIEDCVSLIDKAQEERENLIMMSKYYTDHDETIHHLKFCLSKCESFCGQEKVLEAAKSYILDQSGRKPLIIHAESGVGKTSVMAMIMKSIPTWLNNKSHLKLIRFLGTTPQCMNIYDVMFSVLGQLSDAYDMIMSPVNYRSMKKLLEFTPRYLRQVASSAKETIVILLDSVDQLAPYNNAYSMEWLPTVLPTNLKLIISTLPEEHRILDNLKKLLPDEECYVEVPFLSESAGKLIVDTYLKLKKRTITSTQMNLLLSVFKQSPNPLFLKLLLDEARKWNSYTPRDDLELASTVKEAINKLFSNLETKFGNVLVSHALGFITIGLSGLTEFEIEDVLSCDDEVLNEVYRYHDPPVPGIVRIPPVLWARIRYDIREYLVEKMSHGKTTLYWYHRQFIETARQRYAADGKDASLHRTLVDIYLPEHELKRTITLTHRKNLTVEDADRQITPQPYRVNNRRKLACLPYHAGRAHAVIDENVALKDIYCNFDFLCTKISAYSVAVVVSDLTEFVDATGNAELKLLLNFLSVSKDDLTVPIRLAFCLLAYINADDEHSHLIGLKIQARCYIETKNKPVFIPDFPCLSPRFGASDAFQISLQGYTDILSSSSTSVLLKKTSTLSENEDDQVEEQTTHAVWCSDTQDIIHIDLKEDSVTQYVLSESVVLYCTKKTLVRYEISKAKYDVYPFGTIVPDWNDSEYIQALVSDADRTVVVLVFKTKIALLDIESCKILQIFSLKQNPVTIQNVLALNNGSKLIAVGRVLNSHPDDLPQGPENQCFICVLEQGQEEPFDYIEISQELDCDTIAVTCTEQWFVVATKHVPTEEDLKESENDAEKSKSLQLLIYNICRKSSAPKHIDIPHSIKKIQGNPDKTELAVLTSNGTVYLVKFCESSKEAEILTILLNFPINDFIFDWDEDTAFLCSAGKVTLYRLRSDQSLGAFAAHSMCINDILLLDRQCITLSANRELKVWSIATLYKYMTEQSYSTSEGTSEVHLLNQIDVTALQPSSDGEEFITCHEDGFVKIWSMESHRLLRKYNINISANLVHILTGNIVAFHDTARGEMKFLELESGEEVIQLPDTIQNIIHSNFNAGRNELYLINAPKKGKEQIHVVSINLRKLTKTIHLQSGLIYDNIEISLSANERYIVLKHKIPESEYERIKAMWKTGGVGEQNHRYRFTAVDLSQGTGALMPCFRQQSKIPVLGVYVHPYRGNVVLVSTRRYRRWIILWDIPTGICDQKPSRVSKDGMFYRPNWLVQQCKGANTISIQSGSQKYLACGSQDGYVFIYNSETGLPVVNAKPATRHSAEVHSLVVSPDSKWVASTCRNSVLKLWDATTGVEQFSARLDANVQSMSFIPNSKKLLLYTGTSTTRVLLFYISVCMKKNA